MQASRQNRMTSTSQAEYGWRWWLAASVVAALSMLAVALVSGSEPRVLASWHGLLHSAIASRSDSFALPENPYFAGEWLPYYWTHHWLAAGLARGLGIDALHALELIAVAGLGFLVLAAMYLARRTRASFGAGLLIAGLALCGANPFGPELALGRHLFGGRILFDTVPTGLPHDTVFVSDQTASRLLTQPLLREMSLSSDWRNGANLVWFMATSSRGIALALVLALAGLWLTSAGTAWRYSSVGAVSALLPALNPLIGLASIVALATGVVVVACLRRFEVGDAPSDPIRAALRYVAASGVGAVLALPTYYHLFLIDMPLLRVSAPSEWLDKGLSLCACFCVLGLLAWLGCRRASDPQRTAAQVMGISGGLLLLLCLALHLPFGNEHNLSNAAQVLLAYPASLLLIAEKGRRQTALLAATWCLIALNGGLSLGAFLDRPHAPLAFAHGGLHRRPSDAPLERLYEWVRSETATNAAFLFDPSQVVKMSGMASEFPSFTGRSLFVDKASFITTPHRDFALRTKIARNATSIGLALTREDLDYLHRLARPLYVLCYSANTTSDVMDLSLRYGRPVFRAGFVAVFELPPALLAASHLDTIRDHEFSSAPTPARGQAADDSPLRGSK